MDLGLCQKIAKYIMRPPRINYSIEDLGPKTFQHHNKVFQRIDFSIKNQRNLKLQCSLFKQKYKPKSRQTIVFLHANSSSRLAVKNYLSELLPFFNVACFDSAGSGVSQGNFVTLGYYQKEDLNCVIKHLKSQFELKTFILWGRSMGAATSLLYTAKYNGIQCVISDNAFSDLEQTCKQLKQSYISILPDFLLDTLLESTQQYIDQQLSKTQSLDFKIKKLKPKQVVDRINCPIFYIYSESDKIVNNHHSKILYDLSKYPKRIMSVKGDHNGVRDSYIKGKVVDYLLELIQQKNSKKQNQSDIISNNSTNKNSSINAEQKYLHKVNKSVSNDQQNLTKYSKSGKQAQQIVFNSPLNKDLCNSYLKNNHNHAISKSQIKNYKQPEIISSVKSQTYLSSNYSPISKSIQKSYLNQDQNFYKIQLSQFQANINSCVQNCKSQRKRKKIFSKK